MRFGALILPPKWRRFEKVKENKGFLTFFLQFWWFLKFVPFEGNLSAKGKQFLKNKMWFFDTPRTPGGASMVERFFWVQTATVFSAGDKSCDPAAKWSKLYLNIIIWGGPFVALQRPCNGPATALWQPWGSPEVMPLQCWSCGDSSEAAALQFCYLL